jgi:hypothetical protein
MAAPQMKAMAMHPIRQSTAFNPHALKKPHGSVRRFMRMPAVTGKAS